MISGAVLLFNIKNVSQMICLANKNFHIRFDLLLHILFISEPALHKWSDQHSVCCRTTVACRVYGNYIVLQAFFSQDTQTVFRIQTTGSKKKCGDFSALLKLV